MGVPFLRGKVSGGAPEKGGARRRDGWGSAGYPEVSDSGRRVASPNLVRWGLPTSPQPENRAFGPRSVSKRGTDPVLCRTDGGGPALNVERRSGRGSHTPSGSRSRSFYQEWFPRPAPLQKLQRSHADCDHGRLKHLWDPDVLQRRHLFSSTSAFSYRKTAK